MYFYLSLKSVYSIWLPTNLCSRSIVLVVLLHTYLLVHCDHLTPQTTCALPRCSSSMSHLMTLHLPILILFLSIPATIWTPFFNHRSVVPSTYPISRYSFLHFVLLSLSPIPLTTALSSP